MKDIFGKILGILIALAIVISTGYNPTSDGVYPDKGIRPQYEDEYDCDLQ